MAREARKVQDIIPDDVPFPCDVTGEDILALLSMPEILKLVLFRAVVFFLRPSHRGNLLSILASLSRSGQ